MVRFKTFLATGIILMASSSAIASPQQLGTDFRRMLSNYVMLEAIGERCPELTLPKVVNRYDMEFQMQEKIGFKQFSQLMKMIQKSDLRENAKSTIDKLFGRIDGCEDPRLQSSLNKLAEVHGEAYARFQAEPSLVKPKDVPVPMRRP